MTITAPADARASSGLTDDRMDDKPVLLAVSYLRGAGRAGRHRGRLIHPRNRADDVKIHQALISAGVTLVSATESIDQTPSGMLVHGIMSTIAEFYSRNLANEVTKGMNQKALTDGTNDKPPIGYLNVTKRDELGREMRGVEPDPDRAALVKWAFEAYATGNYSTITFHDALIDRGLMSVPTPKRPSKAPALSTIQKMLTNPYYKGQVSFRGATYDGLHEPLVATEV